jgi:hypothetical protein
MICQEINCPDYLTDEGDPVWCCRAGMPAEIAAEKCPHRENGKPQGGNEKKRRNKHEK